MLKDKKHLLFDLHGTLCDVPIHSGNWWDINKRGIEKVFKRLNLHKRVTAEEFEVLLENFVQEKARLRKVAKQTLQEFDVKKQITDYFEKIKKSNPRIREDLEIMGLSEDLLVELDYIFMSTEFEICSLFEGAKKIVEDLSKKYTLYLLCNNASGALVEKTIDDFGLKKYFKDVFISSEIGFRKPHNNFATEFFKKTGIKKEDCVMIGDRLNQDIHIANKLGIPSIHVALVEHEDNAGVSDIKYDYQIKKLDELRTLLL